MKISQSVLVSALSQAIAFVPSKPTLPVISHFLLAVKDNVLTVSATNLESSVRLYVPCESGKDDWQTTVPARLFFDLVRSLSGEIAIRFKTNLSITCGEIKTKLSTIDANEFPLIPETPESTPMEFKAANLLVCLSNTIYAAATDLSRPILTGVNFKSNGEQLTVSAADGVRMAIYRMPYDGNPFNITIPSDFLGKLTRILSDKKKESVKVYTAENQAFFEFDNAVFVSQLVEGAFVNIEALVPKSHQTITTLKASTLKATLKTLLIIAARQEWYITIGFDYDAINISAQSVEEGDIESPVSAEFEGEPYQIGLSGSFLNDAISRMDGEICMEQNGEVSPLAIYPVDKRDSYLTVLMPMQIRS